MLKRLLILIALCLSVLPASLAQTVEEVLKQAEELDDRKEYLDALVLVERAIDKYPDNPRLRLRQAHLNDARGERLLAFRNVFEAQALFPDNDTILNYLGILYEHSGLLDSALNTYNALLARSRTRLDSFHANINIGSVYNYMQRYPKAIAHYEAMRKYYGDSLAVLANLAQSYADNGQKDKAAGMMKHIISIDPGFEGAYNNLGLLYTEMGKYPDADTVFRSAIRRTPNDALLLNNYGYLLYKMKDYRKALLNINQSISLYTSNPYAYRNRALVYLDMKMMKEACADLKASSELGFKIYYGNEVEALISTHCK